MDCSLATVRAVPIALLPTAIHIPVHGDASVTTDIHASREPGGTPIGLATGPVTIGALRSGEALPLAIRGATTFGTGHYTSN